MIVQKARYSGHRRVWSLWKKLIVNCDVSSKWTRRTNLAHVRWCCQLPQSSE